jgi:hypothetical protein
MRRVYDGEMAWLLKEHTVFELQKPLTLHFRNHLFDLTVM